MSAAAVPVTAGGAAESLRAALGEAFAPVRRYLFGLCGDWHEAEDAAQEALLRAWRSRNNFDGRAAPKTWIFAIARNCWRDRLRRRRTAPRIEPMTEAATLIEPAPSPAVAAGRNELIAAVRLAVEKLPSDQREALALRESRHLTFSETAALLGVPIGTAKSRVRYALLKLADELEKRGFRPEAES